MSRGYRIDNPLSLVVKAFDLVQIWYKIPRETGFQFGKKQSDELTYTHIGDRQTYNDKIKNLIWNI